MRCRKYENDKEYLFGAQLSLQLQPIQYIWDVFKKNTEEIHKLGVSYHGIDASSALIFSQPEMEEVFKSFTYIKRL